MATLFSTYFLYCETAVHAGDGTSSGTIDNPIQRERTTNFPNFRDSTLRGAVRESFGEDLKAEKDRKPEFNPTFGNKENGDKNAALNVYPARILFFPVRSFAGVFGYVTCPFVLKRFKKDMELFGKDVDIDIPVLSNMDIIATKNLIIDNTNKVGLEEFLFTNKETNDFNINKFTSLLPEIDNFKHLKKNLAIVSDTSFKYLVKLFTEKVTRNKIDIKTGTAKDRALFNVEYLPEDSILYTTFGFSNEFSTDEDRKVDKDIQTYFNDNFTKLFELGGDKSIGKGLITPCIFEIKKAE